MSRLTVVSGASGSQRREAPGRRLRKLRRPRTALATVTALPRRVVDDAVERPPPSGQRRPSLQLLPGGLAAQTIDCNDERGRGPAS